MEIKIPCRNTATGEKREFDDLQQVADFLDTQEHPGDWVGFEAFGELPAPSKAKANLKTPAPAAKTAAPTLLSKAKAAAKKVVAKKR